MRIQFLPHQFKTVGISLFILGAVPSFLLGFYEGYTQTTIENRLDQILPLSFLDVLSFIGLLMFVLAKDKVHDEFTTLLRLESAYITIFGTLVVATGILAFYPTFVVETSYFIILQIITYLTIYRLKTPSNS